MPENDDRYVLRNEWLNSRSKIYEKINDVDKKQTEQLHELTTKVEKQSVVQEQALESQKKSEQHLATLVNKWDDFGDQFTAIKYEVKEHSEKLQSFNAYLEKKKKDNLQIVAVLIGGIPGITGAAITLAKFLF